MYCDLGTPSLPMPDSFLRSPLGMIVGVMIATLLGLAIVAMMK